MRTALRSAWLVALVAVVVLGGACSKKKKKDTTPTNAPKTEKVEKGEASKGEQGVSEPETADLTGAEEGTGAQEQQAQGKEGTQAKPSQKKGGKKGSAKPRPNETKIQRLHRFLKEGRYKEVESEAHAILSKDYQNYDAMLVLAEAYLEWGKPYMALRVLDHVSTLKKKQKKKLSCRWHYLMGRYLLSQAREWDRRGLVVEAVMSWKLGALKEFSDPSCSSSPEALFYKGMVLVENRQYAQARVALEKALAIAKRRRLALKDDPRLHINLGVAYYHAKMWKKAYDEWVIALSLKGGSCPSCHYNLALLCSLDEVPASALGMDRRSKASCIYSHAKAYKRYLDQNRIRDKRLHSLIRMWMSKAAGLKKGGGR